MYAKDHAHLHQYLPHMYGHGASLSSIHTHTHVHTHILFLTMHTNTIPTQKPTTPIRTSAVAGYVVPRMYVAFSSPTTMGAQLLLSYARGSGTPLVYEEGAVLQGWL